MEQAVSPVFIQSSKLTDWLLSRKVLRNDYPKQLGAVQDQWRKLCESLSVEIDAANFEVSYLHALKAVEVLHDKDSSTDFFGRVNPTLRSWKDLVASYEKKNLHIAELSEAIHEIASVSVPKCKSLIADRQKLITDLRQKIKEQTSNASAKEDMMNKAYRELRIEVPERLVKLHLLEAASVLPSQFDPFISTLNNLKKALELYKSMCHFVFDPKDNAKVQPPNVCGTLDLLLRRGHVRLYEWEHGSAPEKVDTDDDFITDLLNTERQNVDPANTLVPPDDTGAAIEGTTDLISWDDPDPAEIDFEIIDAPDEPQVQIELEGESVPLEVKDDTTVARGKSARLLLDTIEGRTALMNDLTELSAFLMRFIETHIELHGLENAEQALIDSSILSAAKSFTGSTTIPSNILQNAPESAQEASLEDVARMLTEVENARSWLNDSSRNQLFMIRNKPGYLDRLTTRLADLRTQVDRARGRVAEAQLRIQEAQTEQEQEASALVQYRSDCKNLVTILEKELSRVCNRPIQIVGQVLDL